MQNMSSKLYLFNFNFNRIYYISLDILNMLRNTNTLFVIRDLFDTLMYQS